jgi:hypothetical protein
LQPRSSEGCNFCPRQGKASIIRLMQERGPDMPIPDLLRMFSHDCSRRLAARIAEPCGVHLPELADIFVSADLPYAPLGGFGL